MLIGLSGAAGAGKDTVAKFLVEKYHFKRYAFADAVRDAALALNPWIRWSDEFADGAHVHDRLADIIAVEGWDVPKRDIPEIRRILQVLGTEVGRQILGENCWVDIVARKYGDDGYPNAVITDLRFPNEDEWVVKNGGIKIKIVRPENPDAIQTAHASESYTFAHDFELQNDNDLAGLEESVDVLVGFFTTQGLLW